MRFLLQGICWSSLLNVLEENWSTHFPLQRKNKVEPLTLYSTDITAIIFKIQTFLPSPNWPAREWILTNSNQFRSSSAISPTPGQQILSKLSSCSTRSRGPALTQSTFNFSNFGLSCGAEVNLFAKIFNADLLTGKFNQSNSQNHQKANCQLPILYFWKVLHFRCLYFKMPAATLLQSWLASTAAFYSNFLRWTRKFSFQT